MPPAEKIYELVKDMPPNQISEMLNFAEFLKRKSEHKKESQPQYSVEVELKPRILSDGYVPEGWKDAVYESYE